MSKEKYKFITNDFHYHDLIVNGSGYDESGKGSNAQNIKVTNSIFWGAREDCLDFVRGNNIIVEDVQLVISGRTRQFLTAKGSINGLTLRNIKMKGKRRAWADMFFGDFTIYDAVQKRPPMKNLVLEAFLKENGKRPVICILHCEPPVVFGEMTVIKIPKPIVKIYFAICKLFTSKKRKIEAYKNLLESPDIFLD